MSSMLFGEASAPMRLFYDDIKAVSEVLYYFKRYYHLVLSSLLE